MTFYIIFLMENNSLYLTLTKDFFV